MEFQQYYTSPGSTFSQSSTDHSSPEGNQSASENQSYSGANFVEGNMLQTVPGNFYATTNGVDTQPFANGDQSANGQAHSAPPLSAFSREVPNQPGPSKPPTASHGARVGQLSRQIALDQLPMLSPPVNDLYRPDGSSNGLIKLQGDPQIIEKQRVETAIRATIDLAHYTSPSILPAPVDPRIVALLPRGPDGSPLMHLARTGTFKTLRLQAGTTTKQISKKQETAREQARRALKDSSAPDTSTVYLETAVYKSDGHTRVYACSKCRGREAKRRQSKETSRKNPTAEPKVKAEPVNLNAGKEADGEAYDPIRSLDVVFEPTWDPNTPDWRHEIIIFNNSPEVAIKDGAVDSLPFRVICYGKCHAEKTGFRIKFTIRTYDGRIYGSDMTGPIRITDDHKTDKAKSGMHVSRSAARSRKGTSVMSSQRTSPTRSDTSQSVSEVGAGTSRHVSTSRGTPYDRPGMHRQSSASSVHSVASMSAMPTNSFPDVPPGTAEWPNVANYQSNQMSNINLRRPFPGTMTAMNGADSMSYTSSNPPSIHSSAIASPMSLGIALGGEDLPASELANRLSDFHGFSQQGQNQHYQSVSPSPMLFNRMDIPDGNNFGVTDAFSSFQLHDLSSSVGSHTDSFLSSRSDLGLYQGSAYSDSGQGQSSNADQSEDDIMNRYIDFEGTGDSVASPTSNPVGPIFPSQTGFAAPQMGQLSLASPEAAAPTPPLPSQPVPTILQVVPNTAPLCGGTPIAILGANIPPGAAVMFGGRLAATTMSTREFISCILPPGSAPGQVDVVIQGSSGGPPSTFTYEEPSKEAMKLALKVQSQHPAASSGSGLGFQPSQNGSNGHVGSADGSSTHSVPHNSMAAASTEASDLQVTLTDFLASLNEHSPGSLRHSGAINARNESNQTLIHLATILGYEQLLRRLVIYGAQLDIQDTNGFTPLAFAAYCGKIDCARVLIEAGATYDLPTNLGELPLDLAKLGGDAKIEKLLLSAVWSTRSPTGSANGRKDVFLPIDSEDEVCEIAESDIELDDDNPSDGSEDEIESYVSRVPPRRTRSKHKGKKANITVDNMSTRGNAPNSIRRTPTATAPTTAPNTDDETPRPAPVLPPAIDTPPPYSPASWLHRLPLSPDHWRLGSDKWGLAENWKIPADLVPQPIVSMFHPAKAEGAGAWVTMPVPSPSWDTLQRMTSPDEVKAFTQAMAYAAFNAVVQTGATATPTPTEGSPQQVKSRWQGRRSSANHQQSSGHMRVNSGSGTSSPLAQVVKPIKKDRMFYLFWLPLLITVGFWVLVTLLPIVTGFGLLYARTITRYIKQRV